MQSEDSLLTHVDANNNPTMVDITSKTVSVRSATGQTQIQLPPEVGAYFKNDEIYLKKGPVFQTAIIAGTMAAKKTSELIPFCHQIPVESCKFEISADRNFLVTITCTVRTTFKTGVEMEALQGASQAALVIYDMCKALSHNIIIKETKLLSKSGGKRTVFSKPVYGLVLTGGKSERMMQDKALLSYRGEPHALYMHNTLKPFCEKVFLSARSGQWQGTELESLNCIFDETENGGPISGMLAAFKKYPDVNWVIAACDLVHFNSGTVESLLQEADESVPATCFKNSEKGFPEALCGFYTPMAHQLFEKSFAADIRCPVKVLKTAQVKLLDAKPGISLANINTPVERQAVLNEIR
jgi:cyclic pyranopterin phosphate synthase